MNKKPNIIKKNKEKIIKQKTEYIKKRLKEDPLFKLACALRNRLNGALKAKRWIKNTKFSQYIGCTLEVLKQHIEKQFELNMTWENYGEWHIDHITPLSSAKTEKDIYKLCHYTNLQPLWAIDNIKKGNRINITPM